jgi:hypothetical protein
MDQMDLFEYDTKSIRLTDVSKRGWRDSRSPRKELDKIEVTSAVDIYVNGTLTSGIVTNVRPDNCYDVDITTGEFKRRKITIHKNNVYLCYNDLSN